MVSCNNRIHSGGESFHGLGSTIPATSRAVRVTEELRRLIAAGKKLTAGDMRRLQQDVVDVYARGLAPLIVKIVDRFGPEMLGADSERTLVVTKMVETLRDWDGDCGLESRGALVYNVWLEQLSNLMLRLYLKDEYERMQVLTSAFVDHFISRQVQLWSSGQNLSSDFCWQSPSKPEPFACPRIVIQALLNTHAVILQELGPDEAAWKWRNYHILPYGHLPFSATPLKPFFHRDVPSPVRLASHNLCHVLGQL